MDGEPFYKRLIDDLARSNIDLSYKFKSADQVARQNDTPNGVMPGSPASAQPAVTYTDSTEVPGRPTHPFEVRIMVNDFGVMTKIRCYKGRIYDPGTGNASASFKGLLTQGYTSRKRVTVTGDRGNVSGDQRDFTPSNYDSSGPALHKYFDYNDPTQITWRPDYEGLSSVLLKNVGKDSDPVQTVATYATGSYPIGKDSFTTSDNSAYFEWDYVDGAMIRLFCYDDGIPATRTWGIWGNSGLPPSVGSKGFFVFLAQISGSEVIQMFKSDIVVPSAGGDIKALQAYHSGNTIRVMPGTIGNKVPTINDLPINDSLASFAIAPGGYTIYAACPASNFGNISFPSGTPSIVLGASTPSDTDTMGHIAIAGVTVYGEQPPYQVQISNYLSGSLWGERIKTTGSTAMYYFNTI